MLYLITGTPGAGKTQYTLKEITQNEFFKDREVYTWGIPGLSADLGWHEITDPEKWDEEVPNGACLVIDEAHTVFPRLKVGNNKPPHYEPLSTHRHKGLDIFVITQYPNDLDIYVRGRVGWHYHLKRKMGLEASIVHKQNEAFYPGDPKQMEKCETEIYKFDKKVWELYDSATIHNVQKKWPKKLLWLPVGLLVAFGCTAWAYATLTSIEDKRFEIVEPSADIRAPLDALNTTIQGSKATGSRGIQTPSQVSTYLAQYLPRVEGQPWTAPRYDQLNVPARMPKPAGCLHNKHTNVCRCITYDGSPIDVTREYCLAWMTGKYKYFDDTVPNPRYSQEPSSSNELEVRG